MSFVLIEGGEVWSPERRGRQSVLVAGEKIVRTGEVDARGLELLGIEYEHISASGCYVWPGFIDVHEHLIGGSGESGWGTQTPEITLPEIVGAGITTVVGCLGTDTVTKTMPALLGRAKALRASGLTAYVWSGGYDVPPVTLTGSVRRDIMFVDEVIGCGELAIADRRSTAPSVAELARCVKDAYVGGLLTGKAGVTHFHVGEEVSRLADLRALLDEFGVQPSWVYPTHVERNEPLMREAVDLSKRGVTVDMDVIEKDLARWVRFFLEEGGSAERLTASSDAAISSPRTLFDQVRSCVLDAGLPIQTVLRLVTTNPASVLKLSSKGRIETGADADVLVVDAKSLDVRWVLARGRVMVRDGVVVAREKYLDGSNRSIALYGTES